MLLEHIASSILWCKALQHCRFIDPLMIFDRRFVGLLWTGLILCMTRTRGKLLWTRWWTLHSLNGASWYPYATVQSPSWAANRFAASQEIPRISRNPKVHYRTHKRPPPVSILGQPNPVHIPTSHVLEIRPNVIHPSTPRSPQCSVSFRFPHQDPIPSSPHPEICVC